MRSKCLAALLLSALLAAAGCHKRTTVTYTRTASTCRYRLAAGPSRSGICFG
jgi:hypothetical protein